ncbi:MAG TPA: response regulator [bacterium]|nr:response regulator [bacterium]
MKNQVLIVDDDHLVCRTVQRILERNGLTVLIAENGAECLKKLNEGFRGLILMDIAMPGMDGWETIEAMIDAGFSEGNIICMLTGKENPDDKMEQFKEYVLDYIRKPFRNDQLVEVVKDYLAYL